MSSELVLGLCLAVSCTVNALVAYWLMRTTSELVILGSVLSAILTRNSTGPRAHAAWQYDQLTENDLSCHLGVELTFLGAKYAWPANELSSVEFADLVVDWIVETGRQDLTLEEICQSIKRGDHKGYTRNPDSPR